MSLINIEAILQQHSKQIEVTLGLETRSARIEIQCLLQAALQTNRAYLLSHPEQILNDQQQSQYTTLFERRLSGEPIAYLLSYREFYGLNFKVTPATLIPRPETELLVDLALQRIPQNGSFRLLDLGTGSGVIALSIAHARPNIEVIAVDVSQEALVVARENALRLNIGNVHILLSDWFSAITSEPFDLIVSNPPYIAADDIHLKRDDVRFEPHKALVSGMDGLDDIRQIITQAKTHLKLDGWLFFEHGFDQAIRVRTLLQQSGFSKVFSARDLSGIERVSGGSYTKTG